MITIQNLTKTYRTKSGAVEALRGISAEIQDGDIFGIIGLSGAEKSTLLRCIASVSYTHLTLPTIRLV